jgi:hypothetical protein
MDDRPYKVLLNDLIWSVHDESRSSLLLINACYFCTITLPISMLLLLLFFILNFFLVGLYQKFIFWNDS